MNRIGLILFQLCLYLLFFYVGLVTGSNNSKVYYTNEFEEKREEVWFAGYQTGQEEAAEIQWWDAYQRGYGDGAIHMHDLYEQSCPDALKQFGVRFNPSEVIK